MEGHGLNGVGIVYWEILSFRKSGSPEVLRNGDLFQVAFAIITGEGAFTMTGDERRFMKSWLENGGFLLASAGCSSKERAASLRQEISAMFGSNAMTKVASDHPLFQTLYDVRKATLKK